MSQSSIEDFDVVSRLGSGSYGVVFKVRRRTDDKIYVIKTVRIVDLSVKEQQTAINEVTILSQLQSPFVVHYFDSFISGESLHLVMEYCNKGDLQGLIKKAKEKERTFLPEDLTWDMALQIILGLHYLHGKKILHRDLKAANVFLMKDRDHPFFLVKIGDLGVAKLLDTSTAFAQTIVGTPYYLSPELCADQPYRDKSDCWALGVLLYECCTLRHPFEARNQCALIMKIIQTPVKSPSSDSVSDELSELILWLLAKDPAKRSSTRDILNEKIIRRKLEEHGYELPADMIDFPTTNYLLRNSVPSTASSSPTITPRKGFPAELPPPPPPPPLGAEGPAKVSPRGRSAPDSAEVLHPSVKNSPTMSAARAAKPVVRVGRSAVISPSPRERGGTSHPELSGKGKPEDRVRGDRVRGNQKVQSDKARQRYQVRPSAILTPPAGATKAKHNYDDIGEQLEDTIVGSPKGGSNIAESKMASPVGNRFSSKQEDSRNSSRSDYKYNSSDVSPNSTQQNIKNKPFEEDDDMSNAPTIVTKIGGYRRDVDTVFHFQQSKDEDENNKFSRRPNTAIGRSSSNTDGAFGGEHRSGSLHVLTGDEDCDDAMNQSHATALHGSYIPVGAPNLSEGDYYKDDSVTGNEDSEDSDYDDEDLDVYTDENVKFKGGPTPTEEERKVIAKSSRPTGDAAKMPVRDDLSPFRGQRASDDSFSLSEKSGDSFGGEERTLHRSLLLANALSKDAARLSFMHREKENNVRGSRERRGASGDKIDDTDDDDEEEEDLFSHVLGGNRGHGQSLARTSSKDAQSELNSNGDEDANTDDEEVSERKIKALERTIDESRNIAISILGHELFSDIYDLCVIGMYSSTDKVQSNAKKDEEERHRENLYAQLQTIGVTALEFVSGIKTLIAKESNLNAIKERLKLIHRYK